MKFRPLLIAISFSLSTGFPLAHAIPPRSLTFDQATELGIQENLDLLAAKYNIPAAAADEIAAAQWNNPFLLIDTVFQPFGSNWNQTSTGGPRQYDFILGVPLDLSGKHSAAAASARVAKNAAEAAFADAVRQKVLQIRLAYIDLLVGGYQLSLSRERQESMSRLVTMIQNKIGAQSRLPLLQRRAHLALDQAALDARQRESSLRIAKTALAILLNLPPNDSSLEAVSKLRDIQIVSLPSPETLEARALESRPDLAAIKLAVEKSDRDEHLAHALVWDNFTLTAGLSHQGETALNPNVAGSTALPGAYSWNAGLTIPLPILNANAGGIQRAVAMRGQAEKQLESLSLSIRQEIAADYEQLRLNEGLIRDYEDGQLANARKVRDSQQTLYGTGGSALLDYFDAVNAYQSTVSAYYDVVAEYRRGLSRLNAALGKDLLQ